MNDIEQLADWDCHHLWHAFTPMASYESLVIERAEGVWLFDTRGNRYLDGVSSLWCNLLGHRRKEIDDAIRAQLDRVAHCTSLGMAGEPAVRLAKRLADLAPGDLEHVFLSSDGASAVEAAMKMAFQYWRQCDVPRPKKTRFVAFEHAYHGDTLGAASVGHIDRFGKQFSPLLLDVLRLPSPDSAQESCDYYLQLTEKLLADQHEEIAAVIIEPLLQGAAGMIVHCPGYLSGLRALTQKYEVLLIADEIVTGFGRTGRMFACEHEEVTPDILCLGKSITGGYLPLSATLATGEIYRAFLNVSSNNKGEQENTFFHGHTYGGNPLSAAAALATLDLLEQEKVIEGLAPKIEQLTSLLAKLEEHPCVARTRQLGLVGAVQLVDLPSGKESLPPEQRLVKRICREALSRGLWLRPLGDVLVIIPPLSISKDELNLLGSILLESVEAAGSALLSAASSE